MRKNIFTVLILPVVLMLSNAKPVKDMKQREKLAGQLLEKLGIKKQVMTSFAEIKALHGKIVDKTFENAAKTEETAASKKKVLATADKELSWESIKDSLVKVYAKAYSTEELRKLNNFFSSAAGGKFIAETPKLQRQLVAVIHERINKANRQVRTMAHEFMKKQMLEGKTLIPESLKAKPAISGKKLGK